MKKIICLLLIAIFMLHFSFATELVGTNNSELEITKSPLSQIIAEDAELQPATANTNTIHKTGLSLFFILGILLAIFISIAIITFIILYTNK